MLPEKYKKLRELSSAIPSKTWYFISDGETTYSSNKSGVWTCPDSKDTGDTGFCVARLNHYCGIKEEGELIAEARNQIDSLLSDLEIATSAMEDADFGLLIVSHPQHQRAKNVLREALAKIRQSKKFPDDFVRGEE